MRADGTLSGSELPDRVFYSTFSEKYGGPPDWSAADAISGTWKTTWNNAIGQPSVEATIDGRISGTKFVIEEKKDAFILKYAVGDPDSSVYLTFERAP